MFLAVATAALAAMWLIKGAEIRAVARSDFGSRGLGEELGVGNALGWFAADVWGALLWATAAAIVAGLPRSRRGRLLGASVAVLAGVALALGLLVALVVYNLFGTAPTAQLLATLDRVGDATASIAALATADRIVLLVLLACVLGPLPVLLARTMERRPPVARISAGFLGVAAILALAGEVAGDRSRFDLDRNPLTAFAGSLFGAPDDGVDYVPPSAFHEVLEPIAPPRRYRVDRDAYRALRTLASRRPNIVLILAESTALEHMTLRHPELDTTPFLGSLARRSLVWPHHYAHAPKSIFAIVQTLCSTITEIHAAKPTATRPRVDCRSAPELLAARGYKPGLFHSGYFRFSSKDLFFANRGWDVMVDAHSMPNRGDYYSWSWGIEERAATDAMLAWARRNRDSPLFATYIPIYPHHPYHAPPRFRGPGDPGPSDNLDSYRQAIRYFDGELERLVRGWRDADLGRDTLFIITGDHGEAFGEHPGSKAHGGKLYDEQTRTFTLWYAPGLFDSERIDDRPFGHIDLLPTLLDLLGGPTEPIHQGLSALSPGRRPMVPLYTMGGVRYTGFVDGRLKYIYNARARRSELFDLEADPGEQINLARRYPDLTARYRERAIRFKGAARSAWRALGELGDDRLPETLPPGRDRVWDLDPALGCGWPPGTFVEEAGVITPTRQGSVLCTGAPLAEASEVAITGVSVEGIEKRAAAWVEIIIGWTSDAGLRRQIAYCKMNGNNKRPVDGCVPALIPGQLRFPGGGRLFVELKFYMLGHQPMPESFAVHRVRVGYRELDPSR